MISSSQQTNRHYPTHNPPPEVKSRSRLFQSCTCIVFTTSSVIVVFVVDARIRIASLACHEESTSSSSPTSSTSISHRRPTHTCTASDGQLTLPACPLLIYFMLTVFLAVHVTYPATRRIHSKIFCVLSHPCAVTFSLNGVLCYSAM